jgi:hypothetical protein
MTDDNGMVTLNIYNQPPQQLADETTEDINQTGQGLNLKTDRPQQNLKYYDNVRNGPNYNINSAPRNNYNKRNIQSTIDDSSSSTNNGVNVPYASPYPPQPVVNYQQMPYQQAPMQPIGYATPVARPVVPYNAGYTQPVIVQAKQPVSNNTQPRTIIIQERERRKKPEEDCCTVCLASCAGCVAACCLLMLCCGGGGPGPRRGRGRW